MQQRSRHRFLSLVSLAALSACGGGGSDEPSAREDALARPSYSVGGTITLDVALPSGSSNSIRLYLDGAYTEPFPLTATGGAFNFVRRLFNRDTYNVSVAGTVVGYTCGVTSGGSGTIARSNVTDVLVSCVLNPTYDVPVFVSGLPAGGTVVIQNNGSANRITATSDGPYNFPIQQYADTSYTVTIATQPVGGFCTVPSPLGTVTPGMSPIAVTCSLN